MAEIIHKTFKAEVKKVNAEEGIIDMYIPLSTDKSDREEEMVLPEAFIKTLPKFMNRPVLVSSHNYRDLTAQIGEWKQIKILKGGIAGKPKYYINEGNQQADWGFNLASKGMAAFSIGFIPKEWEDGDGKKSPRRTYKEVELLEISQVIVPSNREAIQGLRSKFVGDPVINELCDSVEKEIVTKPEETEDYIRIPVDTGNHEGHRIRTIDISKDEGIKALYCGTDKVVMTYLFSKDKDWTMEKARAWVKEHEKKSLDELLGRAEISQAEILDELDYIKTLLTSMSDETKILAKDLADEILRRAGGDIPDKDKTKQAEPEGITGTDILDAIKRIAKS